MRAKEGGADAALSKFQKSFARMAGSYKGMWRLLLPGQHPLAQAV